MPLSAGDKLGPYEILAPIGAGGMGEVWKARDTRLNRMVAIKISKARFSDRFEGEARAVAALNHPNICQLYDVGPDYLVMEFIEGSPVAPVDQPRKLLDLAVQIADGLTAAHAAGIIHRDLKPGNILVTREGRVKILDFGLAKAAAEEIGPGDSTYTIHPAITITGPGLAVGTAAYMSPEQARGQRNLAAQSDQFSLGLVLYELASGKRVFQRGTVAETLAAILREDAEPLPAHVPAGLRWIIERLLAKEPAERYDSTRDLYRELRQLRDRPSESSSGSASRAATAGKKRRWLSNTGLVAAGLALGLVLAALLIHPTMPPPDLSSYKFTPISRDAATERNPVWSPDGKSIAYTAGIHGIYQVFTKVVGAPDTAQLTHATGSCSKPMWSPDSVTIYYVSHRNLWSVGASGGPPELVKENASYAAVHPDGKTVVFNRDGKWLAAPLRGGRATEFAQGPEGAIDSITFSPDGSRLAIVVDRTLWILPYPSGPPRKVAVVGPDVSWFPDNRRLLTNGGNFNNTMSVVDSTDGSSRVIYRTTGMFRDVSVSPAGNKIIYSGGAAEWNILEISLPDGRIHTVVGGGGVSWQPDWAPSGTHYLFSTFGAPGGIENRSAADGISRRVVEAPPGVETYALAPRWSPDGTRFLFVQGPMTREQLTIANAVGGRWTTLADHVIETPHTWSPDGQWVAFLRREGGQQQLAKMRPVAGDIPQVLTKAIPVAVNYSTIQWAPTGDWIAYPSAQGTSMISPDGNTVRLLTARNLMAFAFSKNGSQVYGIVRNTASASGQWQLYSIDVRTGADRLLAPLDLPADTGYLLGFSLHPDGKRFLTSVSKWPYDLWMLEGWEQLPPKTWLDRLLRR